jgi:hypothetical protein
MNNIILGSGSKLAKHLTQYVPGRYVSKQEFNLLEPNFSQFDTDIDNLIILAKSNSQNLRDVGIAADTVYKLLTTLKYKHAWLFTSGLGTFHGSKNNDFFMYSAEKMLLNFISYKRNFVKNNIHLIHPGHMETDSDYANTAKKFAELLLTPTEKNLIWSLTKSSYIPY